MSSHEIYCQKYKLLSAQGKKEPEEIEVACALHCFFLFLLCLNASSRQHQGTREKKDSGNQKVETTGAYI